VVCGEKSFRVKLNIMPGKKSKSGTEIMPAVPAAAVMSFLKDTRGLVSWTSRDLAETLGIAGAEAAKVIAIMEMQGYVKSQQGGREYFTTGEGQAVSGSKLPHFKIERVEKALVGLKERIIAARKDFKSPYKISKAVAFGDFLGERSRVQAPDVGIDVVKRKADAAETHSATENKQRLEFFKQLRGRNTPLNVQPYQEWMSKRSHRKLV
jgi:hypothetical protein